MILWYNDIFNNKYSLIIVLFCPYYCPVLPMVHHNLYLIDDYLYLIHRYQWVLPLGFIFAIESNTTWTKQSFNWMDCIKKLCLVVWKQQVNPSLSFHQQEVYYHDFALHQLSIYFTGYWIDCQPLLYFQVPRSIGSFVRSLIPSWNNNRVALAWNCTLSVGLLFGDTKTRWLVEQYGNLIKNI